MLFAFCFVALWMHSSDNNVDGKIKSPEINWWRWSQRTMFPPAWVARRVDCNARTHTPIFSTNPNDGIPLPSFIYTFSTENKQLRTGATEFVVFWATCEPCADGSAMRAICCHGIWACVLVSHLHNDANDRNRLPILLVFFRDQRNSYQFVCTVHRLVKYSLFYQCSVIARTANTTHRM